MEQVAAQQQSPESAILQQIEGISQNMNGWLKFLGIMNIIYGALSAISIIGILIAWLPIWLGVLLLQAGGKATNARLTNNPRELVAMMDKLRLYFVIQGILIIVMIAVALIGVFMFGSILTGLMHNLPEY
ncbi:MAG TPA: hypothetical protein ENK14_05620 [Caldithrix sp.]|nr:hypothetical protein [Caldithrix sp.]